MVRFIMPIILIGISISVFFLFANPFYKNLTELRAQAASYDRALSNSKALESERDKLTAKDNAINPDDKIKLKKFLPDSIDNIRLILEIEQIALPYGMALKDIRYSPTDPINTTDEEDVPIQGIIDPSGIKDYGIWDLEFSTTGTYDNFLSFIRDLESNLRIVDVSSIQFSSEVVKTPDSTVSESYTYQFKIKTYWLKN